MSKHPPPWKWERETNSTWILNDGNGEPIIQGDAIAAFVPDDDVRALVAAAPEMLDILRRFSENFYGDHDAAAEDLEEANAILARIDAASEPRQPR